MSTEIQTASYDQFTDFQNVDNLTNTKSRIVFTAEAYEHFLRLINESKIKDKETGVFFLGKEQGKDSNHILIDTFTTDLKTTNGHYDGGAVTVTNESNAIREKAVTDYGYDCIFHFHVHFAKGYYDVFSDQDLELYKHNATEPQYQYYTNDEIRKILRKNISDEQCLQWRKSFGSNTTGRDKFRQKLPQNKKVSYFGLLATPDRTENNGVHSNYQISAIYCDPYLNGDNTINSRFYRFPNICYIDRNNDIHQIGHFKRKVTPKLTTGRTITMDNVYVQAVGRDPNTGEQIEDIVIGKYIDGEMQFNNAISPTSILNLTETTVRDNPGSISTPLKRVGNLFSRIIGRNSRDERH